VLQLVGQLRCEVGQLQLVVGLEFLLELSWERFVVVSCPLVRVVVVRIKEVKIKA